MTTIKYIAATTLGCALFAGCSSNDSPTESYEVASCDKGVSGLQPATPYDYIKAFKRQHDLLGSWSVYASGTPCATATDAATCEATVAAMSIGTRQYDRVLVNRGDEVKELTTTAEIIALLSPIDSPDEATFLVWWEGYDLACTTIDFGAARAGDDGYSVLATDLVSSCPRTVQFYELEVSSSGTVTEVLERARETENSCD